MSSINPFLSQDQQIVGDTYTSSEMMDSLITLCDDFGSRFGGTDGEHQAAEFFQAKFEEYGLSNVHLEAVEYIGWTRGEAKLEIISPIEKEVDCISLPGSPPTNMEGVIVDMGPGAPEDLQKADEIDGKIVMVSSAVNPKGSKRWIHRSEKYGRSMMAGATGFIFVNHYPGFGPATGSIGYGREGLIPGISICKEDGAFIQRLIERKGEVRIRLVTTDRSGPMRSWNVIGDLRGQRNPEQIVMLGCHYDGHDITQGAVDPISGAVAVMEAARVLVKYSSEIPRTVRFVLWGVEELGLLGSREYVKVHADEMSDIQFYLNLDSAGAKNNNRDVILNEWTELEPVFERWSEEMALEFAVGQSISAHSDHFPFLLAGVPTGSLGSVEATSSGRGYGHTRYDIVDKVELTSLREAATITARLALRLVNEDAWPAKHRDASAVQELLDTPENQDEQEFREQLEAHYAKAGQR